MKLVVAGCGPWGRNLVRTFAQLGALGAVSDPDSAAAERQAGAHGVAALSFEAALARPDISAAVIASPAGEHARMAIQAIGAGKDVLVEKPLAIDLAGAQAIAAAAAASNRMVMVGHLLRYHPAFEALLALSDAGRLGDLRYVSSSRLSLGRIRTQENVFSSFAPHDLSMILALFGEEPQSASFVSRAFITPGVADEGHGDLAFSGGRHAHITCSWLSPFKEQKLVVVGSRAAAVFDDTLAWPGKLVVRDYQLGQGGAARIEGGPGEPIAVAQDEPLRRECQHFLDRLQDRRPPRTGIAEALKVQHILEAARRGGAPT